MVTRAQEAHGELGEEDGDGLLDPGRPTLRFQCLVTGCLASLRGSWQDPGLASLPRMQRGLGFFGTSKETRAQEAHGDFGEEDRDGLLVPGRPSLPMPGNWLPGVSSWLLAGPRTGITSQDAARPWLLWHTYV
ncbi:hypothetical protein NDU88_011409 [Pleurodeles waltl]|uniref:Uncharacterized protein n=1 Tax=Pleurodeles waltl TaxID=8319 RepID=A0AAV7S107_PLEWA|nr:hypothetical protein NDU88_011409 [Pleurodeles waltl]